ncbi:MAG: threonine ammonia-lyase [Acidobacteria bacterium]|nr:threonine ammonia-lyase [Acidobacteriota bacterium]
MSKEDHLEAIRAARDRVYVVAKHTAQQKADTALLRLTGPHVYFKQEIFQRTGSFKIRGAYNKLSRLDPLVAKRGVVAASAGNHAQGVAYAARALEYPSYIFMPETTPLAKVEATRDYGAEVILHGNTLESALEKAREFQEKNQLTYIHGYDDWDIIHGAGTIGLEIVEDLPDVEMIICPTGGGGLISGVALAAKAVKPSIRILGVQAEAAPAAVESFKARRMVEKNVGPTIAEGIAVKMPGKLNLAVLLQMVDDMVLVSDHDIADAILHLLERSKLVCEGAGAASVAALLASKVPAAANKNIVAVLSGGNIDMHTLSTIITRGQVKSGRFLQFSVNVVDAPGNLKRLVDEVSTTKANIIEVFHNRTAPDLPLGYVKIDIIAETRNRKHAQNILEDLRNLGYTPKAIM